MLQDTKRSGYKYIMTEILWFCRTHRTFNQVYQVFENLGVRTGVGNTQRVQSRIDWQNYGSISQQRLFTCHWVDEGKCPWQGRFNFQFAMSTCDTATRNKLENHFLILISFYVFPRPIESRLIYFASFCGSACVGSGSLHRLIFEVKANCTKMMQFGIRLAWIFLSLH